MPGYYMTYFDLSASNSMKKLCEKKFERLIMTFKVVFTHEVAQ